MAPEGRFILDVHQPAIALLNRRPGEVYPIEDFGEQPDGRIITGEEVNYDDAAQVHQIRFYYSPDSEGNARIDELRLRMFFPQELDALLHYNGFEILEKFGDFNEKKFEAGDLKQVVITRIAPAAPPAF
jgi:hypothetical protein